MSICLVNYNLQPIIMIFKLNLFFIAEFPFRICFCFFASLNMVESYWNFISLIHTMICQCYMTLYVWGTVLTTEWSHTQYRWSLFSWSLCSNGNDSIFDFILHFYFWGVVWGLNCLNQISREVIWSTSDYNNFPKATSVMKLYS